MFSSKNCLHSDEEVCFVRQCLMNGIPDAIGITHRNEASIRLSGERGLIRLDALACIDDALEQTKEHKRSSPAPN